METKPVDIYSDASNYGVMRHPGRKFPGSLIQGDSLFLLVSAARVVLRRAQELKDRELIANATELMESLEARLSHYEAVLSEHGISLPYVRPNDT